EAAAEQPIVRAPCEAVGGGRTAERGGHRRDAAAASARARRLGVDHARVDREDAAVTRALRIIAPAKINWTLEVLRVRPDGYHELRSVLQTIDLHDVVTLSDAPEIELVVSGEAGPLADNAPETNLAYRAAVVLRARANVKRGVRIGLVKHIPVAAGLGGGSSDAAAVLRGLNVLWSLHEHDANLMEI